MRICIQAWNELGTERPVGMAGAMSIPFRATAFWADRNGLDRVAAEILLNVINRLDCDRAERQASQE